MSAETPTKTISIAFILCIVFSLLVSTSVVLLKDKQAYNKDIDLKKNILLAAGLLASKDVPASVVEETFTKVQPMVIDVESGTIAADMKISDVNIKNDVKDLNKSTKIDSSDDIAGLSRMGKHAVVYLVKENNALKEVILPIISKGLWSTMYGFIALASDANTVKGFAYYEQGETPGLGGEVDNPKWKSQWIDKKIFDSSNNPVFKLKKGFVESGEANAEHMVDGLSGATITSSGVTSSINFWLGQNGFGPFLAKVRNGEFK